jgi:hypothetical protein
MKGKKSCVLLRKEIMIQEIKASELLGVLKIVLFTYPNTL